MNKLLLAILGMAIAGAAGAKLPPTSPETQAKAEEAKQKTAWSDKVAAFQLCKAQDRVAAAYQQKKSGQPAPAAASAAAVASAAGTPAAPTPAAAPLAAVPPAAVPPAAAPPAAVPPAAAPPAATPVVSAPAPIPTCQDPGPYAAAVAADAAKVGVADSLPVPAAGKPLTPAEAKK